MYKSRLQELCHQYAWHLPEYVTVKDGPDHNPRFSTTIAVNGVSFQTPPNEFRSSKESQNAAAKLAFEHFSANGPQHPIHPRPSAPSASTSNSITHAANTGGEEQENQQTLLARTTTLNFEEMFNLYKNRLQNYAQKGNLHLPTYSYEITGPHHARRFKSKVTIDGKSYETQDFFTTLKDSEHAAAKLAFESMSLHQTQEDDGLYKSLLQELVRKGGLRFPVYKTDRSGPSHNPSFVSTVEIGNESFQGHQAKTKKLAEMNAAKAAYTGLIECQANQKSQVSIPDLEIKKAVEVSSFNLQPNVTDKVQSVTEVKVELEKNTVEKLAEEVKDTDIALERGRISSSPEKVFAQVKDPISPIFSPKKDGTSSSSPAIDKHEIPTSAGPHTSAPKRIRVCPR